MASVLLVLLVATLAVSAGAYRPDPEPQPQPQQPSYPSSSSSCNNLGLEARALSCALAGGALDQVRDKCCNDLGKCGKFICPKVRQVADSIPFLQGMCGDYNACSADEKWSGKEDSSGNNDDCKANECKASVEALKENHMGCFCKQLKGN